MRPRHRRLADLTGLTEQMRETRDAPLPKLGPPPKVPAGTCRVCDGAVPLPETGRPRAYCSEQCRKEGRRLDQDRRREHAKYVELIKWEREVEIAALLNEALAPIVATLPTDQGFRGWCRPVNPYPARWVERWEGDDPESGPRLQKRRRLDGTGDVDRGTDARGATMNDADYWRECPDGFAVTSLNPRDLEGWQFFSERDEKAASDERWRKMASLTREERERRETLIKEWDALLKRDGFGGYEPGEGAEDEDEGDDDFSLQESA
jgi:hypothetical protein